MMATKLASTLAVQQRFSTSQAHQGKVDIRDDEEQQHKLQQCLELLVAAGYYRARIQGLPPFDKIVGGMAWCIETCCIDLDVDLFYNDSLTIGQKIGLTERLIAVLPALQCPHLLQPHQLQGLDAPHILPVMQWLVKAALAVRAQHGSVSRAVAALHYRTNYGEKRGGVQQQHVVEALNAVQCRYSCVRRWRIPPDPAWSGPQRVDATVLEYCCHAAGVAGAGDTQQEGAVDERWLQHVKRCTTKPRAAAVSENDAGLQALVSAAAASAPSAAVASKSGASVADAVHAAGAQVAELQQRVQAEQQRREELEDQVLQVRGRVREMEDQQQELQHDNTDQSNRNVEQLKALVEEVECVKRAEQQYKEQCRQHAAKLQQDIRELEDRSSSSSPSSSEGQLGELQELLQQERLRHDRARAAVTTSSLRLAQLVRAWDEVPGRQELAQYRHRLQELDDLVMSSERETQQFQTMYRTLLDSRTFMERHLTLLNEILDSIQPGIKSPQACVQLLQQVQRVLQSVQHSKDQVVAARASQEAVHGEVSASLATLHDTSRAYSRTAQALSHQLARNTQLHDVLQTQGQ